MFSFPVHACTHTHLPVPHLPVVRLSTHPSIQITPRVNSGSVAENPKGTHFWRGPFFLKICQKFLTVVPGCGPWGKRGTIGQSVLCLGRTFLGTWSAVKIWRNSGRGIKLLAGNQKTTQLRGISIRGFLKDPGGFPVSWLEKGSGWKKSSAWNP